MSRKNRLKKKNKKIQKKIEHISPVASVDVAEKETIDEKSETPVEKVSTPAELSDSIIDAPTKKLIAKDVRMIIFTLVGLALVLVAVRILEVKTPYINTFADWLYKVANIQTL